MARTADRGLENREIVLDILMEVLENGAYIHQILGQALYKYQYLDKADRAFITRTAEGTLDYLIQIDFVIEKYSSIKLKRMKPLIRTLMRMSTYLLLYMDRVPDSAVCNEAVKLAVKRRFAGLKGFVNGVLRSISRGKASLAFDGPGIPPSLRFSIPQWIYDQWEADYGRELAEAACASFLQDKPLWVRCNRSRAAAEQTAASLARQQVKAAPLQGMDCMLALSQVDRLESLEAFQEGLIQVQDPSSALVGELAAPKKGDYVIDVCAAPGGKSLHLADRLCGTGMVEARDLTPRKISLLEENIARCRLENVRAVLQDALAYDPASRERADILLADLPCSGLGIMGRKPDIKLHADPETERKLAALQREILSVVWQYVKPGGLLIYSTCTIDRLENEENARWFGENFPFEPLALEDRLPEGFQVLDGSEGGIVKFQGKTAGLSRQKGCLQLLPGEGPFDGFFISLFKRQE